MHQRLARLLPVLLVRYACSIAGRAARCIVPHRVPELFRRWIARGACCFVLVVIASGAVAQVAGADDGAPAILSRDTKIYVHYDGSLDVTDTTIVNAAAPRGFHRDLAFPGRTLKPDDIFIQDAYEVAPSVAYVYQADGQTDAQVTQLGDGVRITIQPTRRAGPRKFVLDYRVLYGVTGHSGNRLYWPLTVGSNTLPVQHASLRVTLPEQTPSDQIHARFQLDGANPGEQPGADPVDGYRVSLAWPQGIAPGQTLGAVITYPEVSDATPITIVPRGPAWMSNGWIWLAALALYYLAVKIFFTGGRNKPLVAEYGPPTGWSAGAMRLLSRGVWDRKCFATGILGVAAKGGLTLDRQADGAWIATRSGADLIPALTADENSLRSALFAFGPAAPFSKTNAESVGMAELAYRRALERRCAGQRPIDQALLLLPGWLITLAGAALLLFGQNSRFALFAELFLPVILIVAAVAILAGRIPRKILRSLGGQAVFAAVIGTVGLLVGGFGAAWLMGAVLLAGQIFACWWLPLQPAKVTPLLEQIRGFRWYLATAEQQDMDSRFKPSLHPELQASLLPYAMALDVEVAWNARFAGAVAKTGRQADFAASLNPDHASAALGLLAFAESMSSHATAPTDAPGTLTSGT